MPAALAKRKFTVNVAGLRTDVDEHVLPPNAGVLELENCVFDVTGAVSKRRGFSALSTSVAPSGTLPSIWQMATHKGALVALGQVGGTPLYTWDPTPGRWVAPPSTNGATTRGPITVSKVPFAGDAAQSANPDIAVSGNYIALSYELRPGNIASGTYAQVIVDAQTGKKLYYSSVQGDRPRVLLVNGAFVFVSINAAAGAVEFRKWTISTLATVGTPVLTVHGGFSTHATDPFLDAMATGADTIAIAYQHVDNTVHYATYTVSTAVIASSGQSKNTAGAAFQATQCLGWEVQVTATSPVLVTASSALGIMGYIFGAGVAANASVTTVIDAAATTNVRNVTGWTTGATDYNVLYEVTGASAWLTQTKSATKVGGVVTTGVAQLSVGLRSRPWQGPDGAIYAVFAYSSTTQPSYFIVPVTTPLSAAPPVGRVVTWKGNGATEKAGILSSMLTYGTGALAPFVTRTRLESTGGSPFFFDLGVTLLKIGQSDRLGRAIEAAGCLFVPGAMLQSFDGSTYQEANWHVYPEGMTVTYTAAGGGLVAGQTYNWIPVYRYVDAQGRVVRSAPGASIQSVATNDTAVLTVSNARLTSLRVSGTVIIEWYRTTAVGTAYFRSATASNQYNVDTTSVLDGTSDASLPSGELIYTSSSVLASQPPPPLFAIEQFDQRLVGIDAEDRGLIRMTSQFVDGIAPAWNENLTIRLNTQWGDATGLAAMDDKLLIFFRNAIYYIAGVGPDASGNGSYNAPALVATGTGCAEAQCQSIIYTGTGVMFLSDVGFQNIDRGLNVRGQQITDIGAGVQRYTDAGITVVGAIQVPASSEIRFYTAEGTTLCWDYLHQAWAVSTLQPSQTAVMWGQTPVCALAATVYAETAGSLADRGALYEQKITFPWLSLAGLRGYQRLYEVQSIGATDNSLTDVLITWVVNFDAGTALQYRTVPSDLPWNWSARPPVPLATAVKVIVQSSQQNGATNGFKISGLTFLYGVKGGLLPDDKTKRAT